MPEEASLGLGHYHQATQESRKRKKPEPGGSGYHKFLRATY